MNSFFCLSLAVAYSVVKKEFQSPTGSYQSTDHQKTNLLDCLYLFIIDIVVVKRHKEKSEYDCTKMELILRKVFKYSIWGGQCMQIKYRWLQEQPSQEFILKECQVMKIYLQHWNSLL